jgi:hypothetical protein
MKSRIFAILVALTAASYAVADLKPDVLDCNPKKAARNAAMDATVGVSGRCDPGKVAEKTKENVVDDAKDAVDIDLDKNGPLGKSDNSKLRPNNNKD